MNQLTVSLWGDEAFAVILAQKNLHDIITIVARDTSPPLHYILLHFWMQMFGTSEIAIRTLPLLLFVFLAFVVHKFAEDVFGKKAGIWAFFLTLLNPFLFLYAFEARMYMLLALTTVCSMWLYVTKRWIPYVLVTTAALYTHHFALFIVFVQIAHYVSSDWKLLRKEISNPTQFFRMQLHAPFIRSLLAIIILYLPWLPALYGQTKMVTGDFWLSKPNFDDLRFLFAHFIAGATKNGVERTILFSGFLLILLRGFKRDKDSILYLWLLLPPVLTYIMSQIGRPLFFDRYLIISAGVIPILLASQTKKFASGFLTLITIGLIFINIASFQHPVKQPFRDVAQFVYDRYGKSKLVVNYYTDALHYFELKSYGVNVKIYSPQEPLPFWVGTALIDPKDILQEVPKEKAILVMASGDMNKVYLKGYQEIRRERFRDLYLLWFIQI